MTLLVLGVLLWSFVHLLKRLMPSVRESMGNAGKGVVAIGSLVGIVLMVIGYRMAEGPVYWGRTPMLTGLNNLLMLVSIYLMAARDMKLGIARRIRHPMLAGFGVWCLAHLLVNGDLESIVLWGGLWLWAVVTVFLINAAEPEWTKPAPATARKEVMGVVGALVVYGAIVGIHYLFGLQVFG